MHVEVLISYKQGFDGKTYVELPIGIRFPPSDFEAF